MPKMKQQYNIFLCERVPSENRGEAAILEGMIEGLKQTIGNFSMTIYSMRRKYDHSYYGKLGTVVGFDYLEGTAPSFADNVTRYSLFVKLLLSALAKKIFNYSLNFSDELFSSFKRADIVFQGHDNVYRHGIKLKDALVVFYARQYGKKVMIPGATIGPFRCTSFFRKSIVTYVLNNSSLITLRDCQSGRFIRSIGFTKPYYSLTDIAFLMKPKEVEVPWVAKEIVIGFTPTEYVFQELKSPSQNKTGLNQALEEVCNYLKWLARKYKAMIVLIPHVYGPEKKQDDRVLTDKIFSRCKEMDHDLNIFNLTERKYEASELKYLFGQLDLLIACRTHTIIGALGMHTPVLAFTEQNRYKTNGILGDLFGLEQYLYDVQKWDIMGLKKVTDRIINEREKIQYIIESKLPSAKQLALNNFHLLQEIFSDKKNL